MPPDLVADPGGPPRGRELLAVELVLDAVEDPVGGGVFTVVAATAITTPGTELRRPPFREARVVQDDHSQGISEPVRRKEPADWRAGC